MSVSFKRTTQSYIPEDRIRSEILKSHQFTIVFKIARQVRAPSTVHVLKSAGQ